ncbi:hypothetical protein EVAR_103723_1 [Eumeta japonica]|uniref:Uncharacterized protein n=1 Tax=Eumeta variegata TaxID=151549 RepID=A0A4C1ZJV7_EUMVA|nr:hypothetical protein EVAR_103723_1 [Eumeta japonica]
MGGKLPDTPAMKRGRKLEDAVRKIIEVKLGVKIENCGLLTNDVKEEFERASDGVNNDTSLSECSSLLKHNFLDILPGPLVRERVLKHWTLIFIVRPLVVWHTIQEKKYPISSVRQVQEYESIIWRHFTPSMAALTVPSTDKSSIYHPTDRRSTFPPILFCAHVT